jgi:Flp pilus assembly protein TadG
MNCAHERGSLTGMFVCLVMGLLAVSALVFDGGQVVRTYDELSNLAADAARIGGQQIVGIRGGDVQIDERSAVLTMNRYLSQFGESAHYRVGKYELTVTLVRRVNTNMLALLGIGSRTVVASRTVELVQG